MRLLVVAVPLAIVALAACGSASPQSATVSMESHACNVQPASGVRVGAIDFAAHNATGQPVVFAVTENEATAMGSVSVAPGATAHLQIHMDGGDTYHLMCGTVAGPDLNP